MSEEQMEEEKLTAIIGLRVRPSRKRQLMEAATKYGITLTSYINALIDLGLERVEQVKREKTLNKESKNAEAR
jgi:hypothetical protein